MARGVILVTSGEPDKRAVFVAGFEIDFDVALIRVVLLCSNILSPTQTRCREPEYPEGKENSLPTR